MDGTYDIILITWHVYVQIYTCHVAFIRDFICGSRVAG